MDLTDFTLGMMVGAGLAAGWNMRDVAARRVRRGWLTLSGEGECLIETGLVLRRRRGGDLLLLGHLGLTAPSRRAESLRRHPRRRFFSVQHHAEGPALRISEIHVDLSCRGLGRLRLTLLASRSGRRARDR
ncbi:hypothetical protein [Oharaeibacter diazotrophicus]|uniref:Uncharacterized protein n=1 Tax=Oharaeibacter diazotrophicus TaxID=1920512 RepID=A0A4R6RP42_9HYPH|nr:hypothetical protein [Oharaeibacter diazotrophicus]TDP87606.1 hypothetical protein EDD54_1505 [Oharaeibacter diazotrophicus]BBE70450.1 hypothetical protein OHA_1_00012 [Pleomorphomonas sp. SM30]